MSIHAVLLLQDEMDDPPVQSWGRNAPANFASIVTVLRCAVTDEFRLIRAPWTLRRAPASDQTANG